MFIFLETHTMEAEAHQSSPMIISIATDYSPELQLICVK